MQLTTNNVTHQDVNVVCALNNFHEGFDTFLVVKDIHGKISFGSSIEITTPRGERYLGELAKDSKDGNHYINANKRIS